MQDSRVRRLQGLSETGKQGYRIENATIRRRLRLRLRLGRVQGARYGVEDTGCKIRSTKYKVQGAKGYKVQDDRVSEYFVYS